MTTTRIDGNPTKDLGEFPVQAGPALPAGTEVRITWEDTVDPHELRYLLLDMLRQINNSEFPRT